MAEGEHDSVQDQHISRLGYLSNFSTASFQAVLMRYQITNNKLFSLLLQSIRVELPLRQILDFERI